MPQNIFFLPSGHLNEYGLSLTVDAQRLGRFGALPKMISDHVELCDDCKQQIMQIVDQMKDQPLNPAAPHPFFDAVQEHRVPWYRVAVIFLIVLAGGTILYLTQRYRFEENPGFAQHLSSTDSLSSTSNVPPSAEPQHLYAENFIPSANLDNVITSEFRSSSVEVISPGIGDSVQTPVTFRWKNIDGPVRIKILTNRESTLVTSMVSNSVFVAVKKFEPGLYYWKLEAEDELLYLGKFVIR